MLVILYDRGLRRVAESIQRDVKEAFTGTVHIDIKAANAPSEWPAEASWDDLLIVLYKSSAAFPKSGEAFIQRYLDERAETAMVLPVAGAPPARQPPDPVAPIKALQYDGDAKGPAGRLAQRVGAMLGLRLQRRESRIFISYRASDGTTLAKQIYAHLESLGHRPWLDEAIEVDGETKILPGTFVQRQIDDALSTASLVLLIDTPAAPSSLWLKHEVDTADASLLPILPICFRAAHDRKIGPRFPSLVALQRWVSFEIPAEAHDPPLSTDQLNEIVREAETYVCEILRRKCRVPSIVRKEFVAHGFDWKLLDKQLSIFESVKTADRRVRTKVLSHCSIFDQVYVPALTRFGTFLKATPPRNYSLFIYDGELLPEDQLCELAETHEGPLVILHHQELAALIGSGFTSVTPT